MTPDTQVEYLVPVFSTVGETLERERSIREGKLLRLRMPSSGVISALGDVLGSPIHLSTLPLTKPPVAQLYAWAIFGAENFNPVKGTPADVVERWRTWGDELFNETTE